MFWFLYHHTNRILSYNGSFGRKHNFFELGTIETYVFGKFMHEAPTCANFHLIHLTQNLQRKFWVYSRSVCNCVLSLSFSPRFEPQKAHFREKKNKKFKMNKKIARGWLEPLTFESQKQCLTTELQRLI